MQTEIESFRGEHKPKVTPHMMKFLIQLDKSKKSKKDMEHHSEELLDEEEKRKVLESQFLDQQMNVLEEDIQGATEK